MRATATTSRRRPAAEPGATTWPTAARLPLSLVIQGRDRFAGLPARRTLRRWVDAALAGTMPGAAAPRVAPPAAQLTLRFVDAREGRRLNRDYRQRDYATNVLTFDYSRAPLAADIVLCVPVVLREARAQRKHPRAHFAHLVVHGVLHAQGMDHLTDRQARHMERAERRLLAALGYPDPYATAAAPPPARRPAPRRPAAKPAA